MATAAPLPTCRLCRSQIVIDVRHRTIVVDCPTHGHFLVDRTLWEALPRMTPTQKARCFFQLEGTGKRRVLRLAG